MSRPASSTMVVPDNGQWWGVQQNRVHRFVAGRLHQLHAPSSAKRLASALAHTRGPIGRPSHRPTHRPTDRPPNSPVRLGDRPTDRPSGRPAHWSSERPVDHPGFDPVCLGLGKSSQGMGGDGQRVKLGRELVAELGLKSINIAPAFVESRPSVAGIGKHLPAFNQFGRAFSA